jgi:tetratricopeptide (TPR) repeat protein
MGAPQLSLVLLLTGCFSLAAWLGPRFNQLNARQGNSFMATIFGESRRLFADHFYTRSDVYFHSGYYPSIFDKADAKKENHLAESAGKESSHAEHDDHAEAGHKHDEHCNHAEAEHKHDEHCDHGEEHGFLGKPKDPMDAFTRHFFVSEHKHLTEKGTNAPKEILPWIKLAAQLDPQKVESYTVGAYWLRTLNKNDEAEQFLREGLRQNPRSYEIMLELGRSYFERQDYVRARNVLEMAITCWREQENAKSEEQQNRFSAMQILNHLARVEDRTGHRERAIEWLAILKKISPHPAEIDKRIAEVRAGQPLEIR